MPDAATYGYKAVETLDHRPTAASIAVTYNDDVALQFGTGASASLLWETADANANALAIVLPEGGSVDVPVLLLGDASILNADLTFFNGITEPSLAILDDDKSAYLLVGFYANDQPALRSANAITIMPSGDVDDYFTFSTVANVPTITATGATAVAFGSNINLAANKLLFTNAGISADAANVLRTWNAATNDYSSLLVGAMTINYGLTISNGYYIRTYPADNNVMYFKAWDNGVGDVTVALLQSGADPSFQIGRDDSGVALNAVTDMLVLRAGAGTGNETTNFGLGISMKIGNGASEVEERGSWDLVLTTATDGAEDTIFNWNLMAAGAMNLAMSLTGVGVLSVDLGGTGAAAQVDLFDEYDDALVLKSAIQERNRELLVDMGIAYPKENGRYMLKMQPMLNLLAGGIYQTRARLEELSDRICQLESRRN